MKQGIPGRERLALAGIFATAAWLRLGNLELVEFKYDEATAFAKALAVTQGGAWPLVGLPASIGLNYPAMKIYFVTFFTFLCPDPLFVTGCVALLATLGVVLAYFVIRPRFGPFVALAATALMATAPWAVLHSRKIWKPDFLFFFGVLTLHFIWLALEHPRSRKVLFLPVAACVFWQFHFSVFPILGLVAAVLAYRAKRLRIGSVLAGFALATLLLAPYLAFQVTHELVDLRRLAGLLAGAPDPARGGAQPLDLRSVVYTTCLTGTGCWNYVLGGSTEAFHAFGSAFERLGRWASWVTAGLFLGGFIGLSWTALRRLKVSTRFPFLVWTRAAGRRGALVLWLGGIWAFFFLARLKGVYPYYLLVSYPASFIVIALAIDALRRRAARWIPLRHATLAATTLVALTAGSFAAFDLGFQSFIRAEGGTAGDYGVAFVYKAEAARFAYCQGVEELVTGPGAAEVAFLFNLYRVQERASPESCGDPAARLDGARLEVRDALLDRTAFACGPGMERAFGPLRACLW